MEVRSQFPPNAGEEAPHLDPTWASLGPQDKAGSQDTRAPRAPAYRASHTLFQKHSRVSVPEPGLMGDLQPVVLA